MTNALGRGYSSRGDTYGKILTTKRTGEGAEFEGEVSTGARCHRDG